MSSVRAAVQPDSRFRSALAASNLRQLPPGNTFGRVRQRIAQHLPDLASERQSGSLLVAPVSQQELAAAVGTVREVAVRILRDLRTAGLVQTRRDGIVILEPDRLPAETYAQWTQRP